MHNPLNSVALGSLQYARRPASHRRWLAELVALLAFPTISSLPQHRSDIAAAAHWLAAHLGRLGMQRAQVLPGLGQGAPSVYAEWLHAPGKPTLLLYGHFDVQPPGELGAWRRPPFRAATIGQRLYARGASDDKGQLFIHLKALECYLSTTGRLPLNIKVWLEGEEEIGSPHLAAFLDRQADLLRADAVLISDTEMPRLGQPAIITGLRGNVSLELELRGPPRDLHSGRYGGAVPNPIQALGVIIAGLHTSQGRAAIPGFYSGVRELAPEARRALAAAGPTDAQFLETLRLPAGWGEPGYTLFERTAIRPTLNITQIVAGTPGVIPSRAMAQINVRLVPDQVPAEVVELVRHRIAALTPPSVCAILRVRAASAPVIIPTDHPIVGAAQRAVEVIWEQPPLLMRSGGSIPLVGQFQSRLGVPVVLLGFGLPDDHIHGANESLYLPNFFRGVETVIRLCAEYAQ
jgi:acetylornithine deacetylase/succinyl-diaminopimelate desuccinylase-like protein